MSRWFLGLLNNSYFFFFFVLPSHQEIGAKKIKEEDIIRKEEKPHEYLSLS